MPLLTLLLVLLAAPAFADTAADVRAHFKKGQTHYALGEFDQAIEEFREAYRLRQEPVILFNMAQSYRQIHEWQHAYFHYRQYLIQKPDASNRVEVEALVEEMKSKMEEEERAKGEPAPENPAGKTKVAATEKPGPEKAAQEKAAKPPVAAAPQPAPPAAVTAEPAPAAASKGHGLRYAGYAALGAGVLAEGAAFVFHGSAQSSADQFNQKYAAGTLTASDSHLKDDAQSKGKLATLAAIGGAALLVTGAVLTFAF